MMQLAKEIETSESSRPWLWYSGALYQHHYAFNLLLGVFKHPNSKAATTAWKYLNWAFEVPTSKVDAPQKSRWLLTVIRNEMRAYLFTKRLRYRILAGAVSEIHCPTTSMPLTAPITAATLGVNVGYSGCANGARIAPRSNPADHPCVLRASTKHVPANTISARSPLPDACSRPVSYGSSDEPSQSSVTTNVLSLSTPHWVSLSAL